MHPLLHNARIIQNAYVVDNLHEAMSAWRNTFDIGPFILLEHIEVTDPKYRGQAATLDFSAAFVQSGDLNIELIEQHDSSPSAFRDMFAQGQQGFHHIAMIAGDFHAEVANFAAAGYPAATTFSTGPDSAIAFIDTRELLGHMVELYQNRTAINRLYAMVRDAASNWDGKNLIAQ